MAKLPRVLEGHTFGLDVVKDRKRVSGPQFAELGPAQNFSSTSGSPSVSDKDEAERYCNVALLTRATGNKDVW